MGEATSTHVAVSDCERVRAGVVAQPVNTLTSLSFCASGTWLLRTPSTPARRRLGLLAAAAGIGSVAYHGPGGAVGRRVHDLTAVALAGGMGMSLARHGSRQARRTTAALLAVAGAVHASSRTGGPLCRADSPWQAHGLWHVLAALAVLAAAPPVPLAVARQPADHGRDHPTSVRPPHPASA